jgi:hypothetical protein
MSDNIENKNNEDKNKEDHLMDFISNTERQTTHINENSNIESFGNNTRQKVDKIELNDEWQNIPLEDLPYGKFYKIGTRIFVRPTTTKEIQAFAVINEEHPYDVQLKLNELLSSCVKFQNIDGLLGSYKDLQDGDRNTLIIIISKISAKHGRKNEKVINCDCNNSNDEQLVELIPANYIYKEENEDIAEFFDNIDRIYKFPLTINGGDIDYKLAPPTIGLTEDINTYIFYVTNKSQGKKLPNVTFMQCIGYIKAGLGVKRLSIEQLEQEEYNFTKINNEVFEFIYDTIDLMGFGVDSVKTNCNKCGKEMKVPFSFPNGPRALFIVPNAFKQYIRQRI